MNDPYKDVNGVDKVRARELEDGDKTPSSCCCCCMEETNNLATQSLANQPAVKRARNPAIKRSFCSSFFYIKKTTHTLNARQSDCLLLLDFFPSLTRPIKRTSFEISSKKHKWQVTDLKRNQMKSKHCNENTLDVDLKKTETIKL